MDRMMTGSTHFASLESELNDFDPLVRARALAELISLAEREVIPLKPEAEVANMHCHTFFSFNAHGHSPASLAWMAKKQGIKLIGMVDFDVLDGIEEFLTACEAVGIRGSAGMETRVFLPEFSGREINSPGEPGVCYHMGIGLTTSVVLGKAPDNLMDILQRAYQRNRSLVDRINTCLHPITIDYDRDVLPLTPSGNATERHIVSAYLQKVDGSLSDPCDFWSGKLGMSGDELKELLGDEPRFHDLVRSTLIKRGGVGYVQPGPETFPPLEQFHELVTACGAIPCAAWLDGTSEGEQAIGELLELLVDKGVAALNIIPDRNWNIPDPEERKLKVGNLHQVVDLAGQLDLPLNVGTEMNSFGQKMVDDFHVPELATLRQAFIDGAYFIYGHTVLQRTTGLGYQSDWARTHLPTRRERNDFYTRLGKLMPPRNSAMDELAHLSVAASPAEVLTRLYEWGG